MRKCNPPAIKNGVVTWAISDFSKSRKVTLNEIYCRLHRYRERSGNTGPIENLELHMKGNAFYLHDDLAHVLYITLRPTSNVITKEIFFDGFMKRINLDPVIQRRMYIESRILLDQGISENETLETLAEKYDLSRERVTEAIKKQTECRTRYLDDQNLFMPAEVAAFWNRHRSTIWRLYKKGRLAGQESKFGSLYDLKTVKEKI